MIRYTDDVLERRSALRCLISVIVWRVKGMKRRQSLCRDE